MMGDGRLCCPGALRDVWALALSRAEVQFTRIWWLSCLSYRQPEMECGACTLNTTAFNPDIPIHRLNQATRNI